MQRGERRIEYTYDPFHRRLSKTVFHKNKKKEKLLYLWDGDNEIGCTDEKGRLQQLRILGEGLAAEIGSAILYELKGTSYVPIHDHRGSLAVLFDLKKRAPLECYRYTAFGEELTVNRLSPWRFSSKRVDEETNLVYFGRRYYNPQLGRWITQDPQGFEDGPNLYAYLKNSPLTHCDPYGLFLFDSFAAPFLTTLDSSLQFFGFGQLCGRVTHYVCKSDPIPHIDFKGRRKYRETITYIKSDPRTKQSCHEFMNPIYQPGIKWQIYNYKKTLNQYDN